MSDPARAHVANLALELALLVGAAEQASVPIQTRTRDTLTAAFEYLALGGDVNPAPGPDEAFPDEAINQITPEAS